MTNAIQIFENKEFGKIRTLTENDKTLFCAADVAKSLGYSNTRDAILKHCRCVAKRDIPHPQALDKTIEMTFITEGDIYRLIAHSKLPAAEKFESWVFDEVLPSIRKHGGYIAGQENLTDDELLERAILVAQSRIAERDKLIAEQKEQIKIMQPKADYADAVTDTCNAIHIGEFAKILCNKHGVKIGRNKLFDWLLKNKIVKKIGKTYEPYQQYMDLGVFTLKQHVIDIGQGKPKTTHTVFITGKGQVYLANRIAKDFGIQKDKE